MTRFLMVVLPTFSGLSKVSKAISADHVWVLGLNYGYLIMEDVSGRQTERNKAN
ncbi:MAG: hypothetical protein ACJ0DG_12225 [bacterium]